MLIFKKVAERPGLWRQFCDWVGHVRQGNWMGGDVLTGFRAEVMEPATLLGCLLVKRPVSVDMMIQHGQPKLIIINVDEDMVEGLKKILQDMAAPRSARKQRILRVEDGQLLYRGYEVRVVARD